MRSCSVAALCDLVSTSGDVVIEARVTSGAAGGGDAFADEADAIADARLAPKRRRALLTLTCACVEGRCVYGRVIICCSGVWVVECDRARAVAARRR
jgi:hypothetical protein